MLKSIYFIVITLSIFNLCTCLEQLKNTLGQPIAPYSVTIDDYKYRIVKGAIPVNREIQWQSLSKKLRPQHHGSKRYIATFGNKKLMPQYINSKLPLKEERLPEVLDKLMITTNLCCASQCTYRYMEDLFMQAHAAYFTAEIECENLVDKTIQSANVEFVGQNFACKCNLESEPSHLKIESCPPPRYRLDSEGGFCDSILDSTAYEHCIDELPDWAIDFITN